VNEPAYRAEHGTPAVEPAPLPFLNVIEAVFSGIERNRGNRWRFFREIRCNVEGDGPNNRRVAGLLMVSKNYISVPRGL
jgi:hypothetical protein